MMIKNRDVMLLISNAYFYLHFRQLIKRIQIPSAM